MTEAAVGFAGNLTDDPELRRTESGIARAMLRVAVSGRRGQGGVVDQGDAEPGAAAQYRSRTCSQEWIKRAGARTCPLAVRLPLAPLGSG
jgi:hypothetical protein